MEAIKNLWSLTELNERKMISVAKFGIYAFVVVVELINLCSQILSFY